MVWVFQYRGQCYPIMNRYAVLLLFISLISFIGCRGPDDERIESANILFERAVQYTDRGRYEEAESAFRNLLQVDADLGRTERVAQHQRYLGIIAENLGRFNEARDWYTRSIETSRRAASHEGILNGMNMLVELALTIGDKEKAFQHLQNALTYTHFFNYPRGESITLMHFGSFEAERGRFDIAHRHFTRAFQIASGLNDPELQFQTRIALARSYIRQGHFNQAYEHIQEAENLKNTINNQSDRIDFILASGELYEQAGQYGEALTLYEEGWNTHREQPRNDKNFLRLIESLADSYLIHGKYRDALSFYNMLADLSRDYDRKIIHGYALLGKSDGFLKFGIVVDNNDYIQQAIELARHAEAHFGSLYYFTGQAYAVFQQARGASLLGRAGDAIQLYRSALAFLTETLTPEGVFHSQIRFEQRNNLTNPHTAITNFFVNELIQNGRYDDAFRFTELNRQNILNEKVLRIGLTSSDEYSAAYADSLTRSYRKLRGLDYARLRSYDRNRQLSAQRNTLRKMITSTRESIESLQGTLSESLPNSRRLFDKNVPSRTTYQQALPAGRTLISYYATHTHLHTFIMNRGSMQVHSQVIPKEVVTARTQALQRLLASSILYEAENNTLDRTLQREYDEHERWIYNTFLQPVLARTGAIQHAVIVLPTGMHDLPLHALRNPQRRNEFIASNIRFSYLPSATVLTFQLQPPRHVSNIAAFGNPGGNDWDIDYEIRDIRGIFNNARLYLESNATLERLKEERGDILHLVSEFFYQPHFPEHSHFSLTRSGSIAVRNFELKHLTGLHPFSNVVLYNSGDVIEGLSIVHPYLLYLNGSRSIVVNHWKREARPAKWFNENIYSNLSIEYSFIEAYHEAQKTLISTPKYSHPHFWGSFFLYSP